MKTKQSSKILKKNLANKSQQEQKIAKGIEIVYDSLKSHLPDTYNPIFNKIKSKIAREHIGNKRFHKRCVKEYAELINLLAQLL